MNTEYTRGFRAGMNQARAQILEFIGIHEEAEVPITALDIAEEIIHLDNLDIAAYLKDQNE